MEDELTVYLNYKREKIGKIAVKENIQTGWDINRGICYWQGSQNLKKRPVWTIDMFISET